MAWVSNQQRNPHCGWFEKDINFHEVTFPFVFRNSKGVSKITCLCIGGEKEEHSKGRQSASLWSINYHKMNNNNKHYGWNLYCT